MGGAVDGRAPNSWPGRCPASVTSWVADHVAGAERADHRGAGVIDGPLDATAAVEEDGNHVVEGHAGPLRHLDRPVGPDVDALVEEGVDAKPPGLVPANARWDLVRGPALAGRAGPGGLAGRVVRQFALVEDRAAALAVPDGL